MLEKETILCRESVVEAQQSGKAYNEESGDFSLSLAPSTTACPLLALIVHSSVRLMTWKFGRNLSHQGVECLMSIFALLDNSSLSLFLSSGFSSHTLQICAAYIEVPFLYSFMSPKRF